MAEQQPIAESGTPCPKHRARGVNPDCPECDQPYSAEKDTGWLVPQTCVRCGEQTMHDDRVCGRCRILPPGRVEANV